MSAPVELDPPALDPVELTDEVLRRHAPPSPADDADKEGRGRVLVVAGSAEVPGAAVLSAIAALRVGAGRLQVATVASIAVPLGLAMIEARVVGHPETTQGGIDPGAADALVSRARHCRAVLIGPGMADEPAACALGAALATAEDGPPLVLDAAAMGGVLELGEALRHRTQPIVITPHPGEMAHLLKTDLAEVAADPLRVAKDAAARFGAVVVLKGACTHIATPRGKAWYHDQGQIGLATSGSGDVLSGLVAGLLARGADPVSASLWAVRLHRQAGLRLARKFGPLGYLARELLAEIPGALCDLTGDAR